MRTVLGNGLEFAAPGIARFNGARRVINGDKNKSVARGTRCAAEKLRRRGTRLNRLLGEFMRPKRLNNVFKKKKPLYSQYGLLKSSYQTSCSNASPTQKIIEKKKF